MSNNEQLKTGTTCVAIKYKDGIVMASDRRISAGYIVSENYSKLIQVSDGVVVAISGLLSAAQYLARVVGAEIKLKELNSERKLPSIEIASMISAIIYSSVRTPSPIPPLVGFLVGIYDGKEMALYSVGHDGSCLAEERFAATGSGSIFIHSLLESRTSEKMKKEEAIQLAEEAIISASNQDLYSGGGVVMKIIDKDGVQELSKKKFKMQVVQE